MKSILRRLLPLGCGCLLAAQTCIDPALGTAIGNGDDVMLPMQSIGFAFPFAGATYTHVHVCTNGYVCLSNAGVPAPGFADYSATLAEFVAGSPRIAPMWNDFDLRTANGGQVFLAATATRCLITWRNAQPFNLLGAPLFDVQLELLPAGQVRFAYSPTATNNSFNPAGRPAITGVTPGGGATLPAASNLQVPNTVATSTMFEAWQTALSFDLANRFVVLAPAGSGWSNQTAPLRCAAVTSFGAGCVASRDSVHETLTPAGFDLFATPLRLVRTATGYELHHAPSASYVPPGPAALVVADGDDQLQTVPLSVPMPRPGGLTNVLTVASNGNVALGASGTADAFMPAATFLGLAEPTIAASWRDYDPTAAGSGKVYFEEVAGVAYVSWHDVRTFAYPQTNRFQCQFDLATGTCTIVYVAMGTSGFTLGDNHLVGYSPGGPSPDPGPTNLSNVAAGTIRMADHASGLLLRAGGLPRLGDATFSLLLGKVPNVAPLAFLVAGTAAVSPGVPLVSVGMPGCFAYTNADVGSLTFPVAQPSGDGMLPLPIPASASLAGVSLTTQALAFTPLTPLGLATSNGLELLLGY